MGNRVFITGISGFVGNNLADFLKNKYIIQGISRNKSGVNIDYHSFFDSNFGYDVFIHLAGKAHDLKKTSNDNEYNEANFELTKRLYNSFLKSEAAIFIYVSSVKAVKDVVKGILTEEDKSEPITAYGKSKKMAEDYILRNLPSNKQVYILRPCMIHGPGNKGNLNLLYNIVKKGIPYPLASYANSRSFLSIDNFCFVVEQLLCGNIKSGVYQLADDTPLATNEVINLAGQSLSKKIRMWYLPKSLVNSMAKLGDLLKWPLNSERLQKLTENYVVSNEKIVNAIGKSLPLSSTEGLTKTFKSFNN